MAKKKSVALSEETKRAVEEGNKIREQLTNGAEEKKVPAKNATKKQSTTDEKIKKASEETTKELKDVRK